MRYTGNDHDPFGMLLVDRIWQSTTTYKYGFNGQELDDEIYGNGNLNTADFWEYDTRLGRRWNVDPIIKNWESPYACFFNNSIVVADVNGADGTVQVDKSNHTVKVSATYYYNENNEQLKKAHIITGFDVYNADGSKAYTVQAMIENTENGWEAQSYNMEINGECWDITFDINFVPLSSEAEIEEKRQSDPTCNILRADLSHRFGGEYQGYRDGKDLRELWIYGEYNNETLTHEEGHGFGLNHSRYGPNHFLNAAYFYSEPMNPYYGDENNGYGQNGGPIMSWAFNTNIYPYEVKLIVTNAIELAQTVEADVVIIHIKSNNAFDTTQIILQTY